MLVRVNADMRLIVHRTRCADHQIDVADRLFPFVRNRSVEEYRADPLVNDTRTTKHRHDVGCPLMSGLNPADPATLGRRSGNGQSARERS